MEDQGLERPRTGRDRVQIVHPRVVARHDVGLVRADDHQPLIAPDAGEKGEQGTGCGIREVEILEDDGDGPTFAKASQEAEDPFQRSGLAPLRRGHGALGEIDPDRRQARPEIRHEAHDLGRGTTEHRDEVGWWQAVKRRPDGPDDRSVGCISRRRPGGRPQDRHRLEQGMHPGDHFVEQPGRPDPGGPIDQQRARPPVDGIVETGGKARECLLASNEARARVPGGHDAF